MLRARVCKSSGRWAPVTDFLAVELPRVLVARHSCVFMGIHHALASVTSGNLTRWGLASRDQRAQLVVVSPRPNDYEVAPVETGAPANEVDRGEQLEDAHGELGLVNVHVAEARAEDGPRAGQQHVQGEADVRPAVAHGGHVGDELPRAEVLVAHLEEALLNGLLVALHVLGRDLERCRLAALRPVRRAPSLIHFFI